MPYRKQEPGEPVAFQWISRVVPLYSDDAKKRAVWYVHPEFRHRVDIAAIEIDQLNAVAIRTANDALHDLSSINLYPSLDAFVLGFPRGITGGGRFPIWKRGTIATEPDIDLARLPQFYIDTATREGMSGGPVYAQEVGAWMPAGVRDELQRVIGKGRAFVGIYAGRIGWEDEFKAQLGIVWKVEAIESVISAKQLGESSFQMAQM